MKMQWATRQLSAIWKRKVNGVLAGMVRDWYNNLVDAELDEEREALDKEQVKSDGAMIKAPDAKPSPNLLLHLLCIPVLTLSIATMVGD